MHNETLDDYRARMVLKQHDMEVDARSRAINLFRAENAKLIEYGMEERTAAGRSLLHTALKPTLEAVEAFLAKVYSGKAGRRHTAGPMIKSIGAETATFIALQCVISGLHRPDRSFTSVAAEIGSRIDDELRLSKVRETHAKTYEKLVKGAKQRISYASKKVYAMRVAKGEARLPEAAAKATRLHTGYKLVELIAQATGLVEVKQTGVGTGKFEYKVKPTEEVLKWIDERNTVKELQRPLYEPMVCPPVDWRGPWGGGYLSPNMVPFALVKTRGKGALGELAHAHMPAVYAAINAAQRTPWAINTKVLAVMTALWDASSEDAGLPPREGRPLPPKPGDIDDNPEARRKWRDEAARVYRYNAMTASRRATVTSALNTAARFAEFKEIYFPYQFDFRGRMYAVPAFNPQGADPVKGLLQFAHGKPVGDEGEKWLAVQGANLAGYDKVSHQARYDWVIANEDTILDIARDPLGNRAWCGTIGGVDIDAPWQFLGWCFEWAGYIEHGPEWVSRIPCTMDGSCSGIQHFSAMLRDPVGGAAVNLLPSDKPNDVYRTVADQVLPVVQRDAEHGTEDTLAHHDDGHAFIRYGTRTLARAWLAYGITRKVTKRPVMTLCYGATKMGFRDQIMEDTIKPADIEAAHAGKPLPFDAMGRQAAAYMGDLTWDAVGRTLVAAHDAMAWLREAAAAVSKENLPVRWVTPSGFPVVQATWAMEVDRVRLTLGGATIKTRIETATPKINTAKARSSIAPNFVHSCDAAHLALTVARAAELGLTEFALVHDSFGTTAADMDTFYGAVRAAFVAMYRDHDVLAEFAEDVSGVLEQGALPDRPKAGNMSIDSVLASAYCFA